MKLRDLVLHNFRLKVFSLLMAGLIWGAIHLNIVKQETSPPRPPAPAETNQFPR